jgi:hypothetical protein
MPDDKAARCQRWPDPPSGLCRPSVVSTLPEMVTFYATTALLPRCRTASSTLRMLLGRACRTVATQSGFRSREPTSPAARGRNPSSSRWRLCCCRRFWLRHESLEDRPSCRRAGTDSGHLASHWRPGLRRDGRCDRGAALRAWVARRMAQTQGVAGQRPSRTRCNGFELSRSMVLALCATEARDEQQAYPRRCGCNPG